MTRKNKNKSALIFGGSGFIGTHLRADLKSQGFQVIVADLISCRDPDVQYIKCDVREEINLTLEDTPQLVYNLAAVHRTPGHEENEYYETNVGGAINITNWCRKMEISKIIFTSSISVYGTGSERKSESSKLMPDNSYGKSKMLAEKIFKIWQSEAAEVRRLIICRPAVIFGKGENGNFTRLADALRRGYFFFPGGPHTVKACGYVKDLVRSLSFVVDQNSDGLIIYNFCFPIKYTIGEICRSFQDLAGYRLPQSLPFSWLGRFLILLPKPFDVLGARILKLVLDTNIEPKYLLGEKFKWETNLHGALLDWQSESSGRKDFE